MIITQNDIIDAYLFLRKNNQTIPSETLEFMKNASIEKLNEINLAAKKKEEQNNEMKQMLTNLDFCLDLLNSTLGETSFIRLEPVNDELSRFILRIKYKNEQLKIYFNFNDEKLIQVSVDKVSDGFCMSSEIGNKVQKKLNKAINS